MLEMIYGQNCFTSTLAPVALVIYLWSMVHSLLGPLGTHALVVYATRPGPVETVETSGEVLKFGTALAGWHIGVGESWHSQQSCAVVCTPFPHCYYAAIRSVRIEILDKRNVSA